MFFLKYLMLFCALIVGIRGDEDITRDDEVIVITTNNFQNVIDKYPHVLIEFCAFYFFILFFLNFKHFKSLQ